MQKNKHQIIVKKICEKLGLETRIVNLIIKNYFRAIRRLVLKNQDIRIPFLGTISMRSKFRKVIEKKGIDFNLRSRRRKKSIHD